MRPPTIEALRTLMTDQRSPCVSLYQPTHRRHPENQQDSIRYRNLLREMQTSLREQYAARDVQPLTAQFEALAHDDAFWNRRTEGLAILGSPERFELFELQRSVPERVVVAASFHVKPLLRIVQSADRYHILGLNRREAKLYEGNRDALDAVELANVPATITAALGEELTEPQRSFHSAGDAGIHHGRGQKKDEVDLDTERFFRVVDRAILEHYSRPSGLPLILAALPEHHAPFRKVTHNPFLMDARIEVDPDALGLDELRARAWQQVEPVYLERLARLIDSYQLERSRGRASEDLAEIGQAAVVGRVDTLLIEAERLVAGHVDATTGKIERGALDDPSTDDLLDDLAETVLRMKGEAIVVPVERMPARTGAAAIYRY